MKTERAGRGAAASTAMPTAVSGATAASTASCHCWCHTVERGAFGATEQDKVMPQGDGSLEGPSVPPYLK